MFYVKGKATKEGITTFFEIETSTTADGSNRYIIDQNAVFEVIFYQEAPLIGTMSSASVEHALTSKQGFYASVIFDSLL